MAGALLSLGAVFPLGLASFPIGESTAKQLQL
jgi:hypothetical protein